MGNIMSLIIAGSTSGTITLDTPAVAGTQTATLPAATGTVMVSGNMPAFSAGNATYQVVSSATWTKVILNTKTGSFGFDTNSYFDATTNYRFTPLIAGYYQINATVSFGSLVTNPTGGGVGIYKNGSQYMVAIMNSATPQFPSVSTSAVIYMNGSTDYVEMYGYAFGGTSPAFSGGAAGSIMSGSLVRAS